MQRILVTGASGFIGTHLVPQLKLNGYQVDVRSSVDGDVALSATWEKFPTNCDVLVHLAARSFVPESWKSPSSFIKANVSGTLNALSYCHATGAQLIFLSSYLYGNPDALPIPETAILRPTNPYARSKMISEELCDYYVEYAGVNVSILRPFNVYGPDQGENFLIPSIVHQVKSKEIIEVLDLEPKRDYVFISDVVDAIIKTIGRDPATFNIGSGESFSVEEVIEMIQSVYGTTLPVKSVGVRRKDEIMDTIADISKARTELGWEPRVQLIEGIKRILS